MPPIDHPSLHRLITAYWPIFLLLSILAISQSGLIFDRHDLEFQRHTIDQGQWWRLLTCHITHLSTAHYLSNSLGILLVCFVRSAPYPPYTLLAQLCLCSFVVGAGLYLWAEELPQYAGFSGVVHGLLLIAACQAGAKYGLIKYGLPVLLIAKIGWELSPCYNDQALLDMIGGRVEVRSHALGLIAGGLYLSGVTAWAACFPNRHTSGEKLDDH